MKRLTLKKLLVLSYSLGKSIEVPFTEGLNIVVGGNKTGKSSLIKTVFDCFGCATRIESRWKDIVSVAAVIFSYGSDQYCIVKRDRIRDLFALNQDEWKHVISTSDFSEFNDKLMNELDILVPCVPVVGSSRVIPPAVLFSLQYIDQDDGWSGIAKSFSNSRNTKNWRKLIGEFASGFHSEDYFELNAEVIDLTSERNTKQSIHEMNLAFYERIKHSAIIYQSEEDLNPEEQVQKAEEAMREADACYQEMVELEAQARVLERSIYRANANKKVYCEQLAETQKDIKFALNGDEKLICPCCGAEYANTLEQHLVLCEDVSVCETAIIQLEGDIERWRSELSEIRSKIHEYKNRYQLISSEIRRIKGIISHEQYIKQKGRAEILEQGEKDLASTDAEIQNIDQMIKEKKKELRKFASKKRKAQIVEQIETQCATIAQRIQYPTERIRLRDFIQITDETGSDAPKCIYMYYVAMYLYNLQRGESPFNFLVVDTPNQQGQDVISLESIMGTLELVSEQKGQFILCTERETGYEENAQNIFRLKKKRECLSDENFEEHATFFKNLLELCV